MTVRQQIRDQIIAEINADRPTGVPEATKRRFVPGEILTAPRIAVFWLNEENALATGRHSPLTTRDLIVVTQCLNVVQDVSEADDSVEPFLDHLVRVLGSSNLQGLALDIEERGTQWEIQFGDLVYVAASTRWRVSYQTRRDNIAQKQ